MFLESSILTSNLPKSLKMYLYWPNWMLVLAISYNGIGEIVYQYWPKKIIMTKINQYMILPIPVNDLVILVYDFVQDPDPLLRRGGSEDPDPLFPSVDSRIYSTSIWDGSKMLISSIRLRFGKYWYTILPILVYDLANTSILFRHYQYTIWSYPQR